MNKILIFCIAVIIIIYIVNIAKVVIASKAIVRSGKSLASCQDTDATVFMIIPVYKEQGRIEKCINTIEQINWPENKLKVCICTTEKELLDESDTQTICQRLLEENNYRFDYEIVRYPYSNGNMAEQVNYAYTKCPDDVDIVSIYNADSVIDINVLKLVNRRFLDESINYIQQRAIYNNYSNHNMFSIGYIFYQSIFEIKKNIIKDMKGKGENVVGRALFIRKSALFGEIYPTDFYCEDMALSMKLVNSNENIGTIPVFEINEPPARLKDIINQQYVWFHTASKISGLVNYAKESTQTGELNGKARRKVTRRVIDNLVWVFTSIVMLALSIVEPVFLLITYGYCLLMTIVLNRYFELRSTKTIFFDSFCYAIYLFIVSWGPIKYLLMSVAKTIGLNVNDQKYKTPRGGNNK